MTAVRPPILPPVAPVQRPDAGRAAAQKAFFDLALGKAAGAAPAAAVSPRPADPQPTVASQTVDSNAPAPARILRPGSLLDIRV